MLNISATLVERSKVIRNLFLLLVLVVAISSSPYVRSLHTWAGVVVKTDKLYGCLLLKTYYTTHCNALYDISLNLSIDKLFLFRNNRNQSFPGRSSLNGVLSSRLRTYSWTKSLICPVLGLNPSLHIVPMHLANCSYIFGLNLFLYYFPNDFIEVKNNKDDLYSPRKPDRAKVCHLHKMHFFNISNEQYFKGGKGKHFVLSSEI